MQSNQKAPPVIDSSFVRAFATVSLEVTFTGRQCVIVDGVKVGPASRVVIASNQTCNDYLLLLCNDKWESFAVVGFPTMDEALATAERWYDGISRHWILTNYSSDEDRRHLAEYYGGAVCSSCGALPNQVESMIEGNGVYICDKCAKVVDKG